MWDRLSFFGWSKKKPTVQPVQREVSVTLTNGDRREIIQRSPSGTKMMTSTSSTKHGLEDDNSSEASTSLNFGLKTGSSPRRNSSFSFSREPLDLPTWSNVTSPGFTSRLVQQASGGSPLKEFNDSLSHSPFRKSPYRDLGLGQLPFVNYARKSCPPVFPSPHKASSLRSGVSSSVYNRDRRRNARQGQTFVRIAPIDPSMKANVSISRNSSSPPHGIAGNDAFPPRGSPRAASEPYRSEGLGGIPQQELAMRFNRLWPSTPGGSVPGPGRPSSPTSPSNIMDALAVGRKRSRDQDSYYPPNATPPSVSPPSKVSVGIGDTPVRPQVSKRVKFLGGPDGHDRPMMVGYSAIGASDNEPLSSESILEQMNQTEKRFLPDSTSTPYSMQKKNMRASDEQPSTLQSALRKRRSQTVMSAVEDEARGEKAGRFCMCNECYAEAAGISASNLDQSLRKDGSMSPRASDEKSTNTGESRYKETCDKGVSTTEFDRGAYFREVFRKADKKKLVKDDDIDELMPYGKTVITKEMYERDKRKRIERYYRILNLKPPQPTSDKLMDAVDNKSGLSSTAAPSGGFDLSAGAPPATTTQSSAPSVSIHTTTNAFGDSTSAASSTSAEAAGKSVTTQANTISNPPPFVGGAPSLFGEAAPSISTTSSSGAFGTTFGSAVSTASSITSGKSADSVDNKTELSNPSASSGGFNFSAGASPATTAPSLSIPTTVISFGGSITSAAPSTSLDASGKSTTTQNVTANPPSFGTTPSLFGQAAPSTTTASSDSTGTTFGSPVSTTTSTPGFSFGGNSGPSSGFSFTGGAKPSPTITSLATSSPSTFSGSTAASPFGSNTTTSKAGNSAPSTNALGESSNLFGQTTTTTTAPSSGSFGAIFKPPTTTTANTGFSFGGSAAASSGGFSFSGGSNPPTTVSSLATSPPSAFGGGGATNTFSPSPSFGSSTTTTKAVTDVPSTAPTFGGSGTVFGQTTAPTTTGSSVGFNFTGGANQSPAISSLATSSSNTFGGSSAASPFGSNTTTSKAENSASSAPAFGGASNLFGQTTTAPSSGSFGTAFKPPTTTTANTGFSFGGSAASSGGFSFSGGGSNQPTTVSSLATSPPSAFGGGGSTNAFSSASFGSTTTTTKAVTDVPSTAPTFGGSGTIFGQTSTPTTTASAFGSVGGAPPNTGFSFGSNAASTGGISFSGGANPATTATSPAGAFGGNGQTSVFNPPTAFGSSTSTSTSATGVSSNPPAFGSSGTIFGQAASTAGPDSSFGTSFGSGTAPANAGFSFGSGTSAQAPAPSTPFQFGQQATQGVPGGFNFAAAAPAPSPGGQPMFSMGSASTAPRRRDVRRRHR